MCVHPPTANLSNSPTRAKISAFVIRLFEVSLTFEGLITIILAGWLMLAIYVHTYEPRSEIAYSVMYTNHSSLS